MFPLKERSISGYRWGEPTFYSSHHLGLDLKAHYAPLFAPFDGVILEAFSGPEGGRTLWFKPDHDNVIMRFLHLDYFPVKKGERVRQGQQIAITGNSGKLTKGPHLHLDISRGSFVLKWPGNFIDPETYNWDWKPSGPPLDPPINVPTTFWVTVTVPKLNVRVEPTTSSSLVPERQLRRGDRVECTEGVLGQNVEGESLWLKTRKNKLYIWSGGTDYKPLT